MFILAYRKLKNYFALKLMPKIALARYPRSHSCEVPISPRIKSLTRFLVWVKHRLFNVWLGLWWGMGWLWPYTAGPKMGPTPTQAALIVGYLY